MTFLNRVNSLTLLRGEGGRVGASRVCFIVITSVRIIAYAYLKFSRPAAYARINYYNNGLRGEPSIAMQKVTSLVNVGVLVRQWKPKCLHLV